MGPLLAILSAISWSFAVILFKKAGDNVHPIVLNLYKNVLALILLVPTLLLAEGALIPTMTSRSLWVLFASGFIGIAVADAMLLRAIQYVGASRVAILECSYSPFVIALSLMFLGENLNLARVLGTILIIGAILCVSFRRDVLAIAPERMAAGTRWGIVSVFGMAMGIVMTKPLLDDIPFFWIVTLRMLAGVAGSIMLFAIIPEKRQKIRSLLQTKAPIKLTLASILATYVAMIFWVAGYKYADATVVAVLNQTSTIFTVLLAALLLKEGLGRLKILGTLMASAGVVLITLG